MATETDRERAERWCDMFQRSQNTYTELHKNYRRLEHQNALLKDIISKHLPEIGDYLIFMTKAGD